MSISRSKFWTIILLPIGGFLLWGILGNVLDHFLDSIGLYEKVNSLNPQNGFRQFISLTVPVWKLLLVFLVFGIPTYFLLRNRIVWKVKKTRQEDLYSLIDEFKVKFKFMENPFIGGVQYKTTLSLRDGNIYLDKIEPYCDCHTTKLQMIEDKQEDYGEPYFKCPDFDCLNYNYDIEKVKSVLYSQLEEIWDKKVSELN